MAGSQRCFSDGKKPGAKNVIIMGEHMTREETGCQKADAHPLIDQHGSTKHSPSIPLTFELNEEILRLTRVLLLDFFDPMTELVKLREHQEFGKGAFMKNMVGIALISFAFLGLGCGHMGGHRKCPCESKSSCEMKEKKKACCDADAGHAGHDHSQGKDCKDGGCKLTKEAAPEAKPEAKTSK